ncbi:methyltransferase family protein [candidate division KSB1 bacterium]
MPTLSDYIFIAAIWTFWGSLHSFMISAAATNFLKQRAGEFYKYYRIFFNAVALLTLAGADLYSSSFTGREIFVWEKPYTLLRSILFILALILFYLGGRQFDMKQFLGIRQILTGANHAVLTESGQLNTGGILHMTRHPWYLGAIILIWSFHKQIDTVILMINSILTVYVVIGTILEEKKLIAEFGDEYRGYQQSVSMLFPWKYVRQKFRQ